MVKKKFYHYYLYIYFFADAYEPSREFNTKFLKKIAQNVKNYSADGPIYLHVITNFAEKVSLTLVGRTLIRIWEKFYEYFFGNLIFSHIKKYFEFI
jgi:hypothetical protein